MEIQVIISGLLIVLLIFVILRWLKSNEELKALTVDKVKAETTLQQLQTDYHLMSQNLQNTSAEMREKEKKLLTLQVEYRHLQEQLSTQRQELSNMQEKFKHEFESLANRLLEDKSKKFAEQNKAGIETILQPLGEKIKSFEERVERTNLDHNERSSRLMQQIDELNKLNQTMAKEAHNLTKALKGESKTQGNWGEVVLERILEKSGLTKNQEYFIQESVTTADGRRLQPDVVIRLPENKCLIIDSKVSLTAYERYASAESGEERQNFLKAHLASVRSHVTGLSSKNYHQLYDQSADFTLLFIPIEPAFALAFMNDDNLYMEALERNIVIVSTSTLLATLRTIASIWKQEYQNKNALEIAARAGDMYDKFVTFVGDLEKLGDRIGQTNKAYDDAMNKLTSGRGNLIARAENMRKLGIRASKKLPANLLPDETIDEETEL